MKYEIDIEKTETDTSKIFEEIQNAFYDIPFENSTFQTEAFVISAEITPERAYRAIGLRLMSKLASLREAKYSYMKTQIDLDEIEFNLKEGKLNQFDIRRELIKKEEILNSSYMTNKLIHDAITDLNTLYKHFKALPKYTREQFEASERQHFEQRLLRQVLNLDGAKNSIINMNEDLTSLLEYEEKAAAMPSIENSDLLTLSMSLTNMLKKA
jgi:hypothetical protein